MIHPDRIVSACSASVPLHSHARFTRFLTVLLTRFGRMGTKADLAKFDKTDPLRSHVG